MVAEPENEAEDALTLLRAFIRDHELGEAPDVASFAGRLRERDQRREFTRLAGEYLSIKQLFPERRAAPSHIGAFRILGEVGRGGMGIVYEASDPQGMRVALKVLREDLALSPAANQRFEQEVRALEQLDHPGIVRVLESGMAVETFYVAMEFLDGGTLEERIRSQATRSAPRTDEQIAESCAVIVQVARALEVAHDAGIIHRDLKPSNILFDAEGRPYLSDFGLAHLEESSTITTPGKVLGTPAYLAPERVLVQESDSSPRVDVYSLGVCLYECVTGARPYYGSFPEILAASKNGLPPAKLFLGRSPGHGLEAIMDKATSYVPGARYSGADELAADLERHLAGKPPRALWSSAYRKIRRRLSKRSAIAASLVTAAVVLVGGLFLRNYLDQRRSGLIAATFLEEADSSLQALRRVRADFDASIRLIEEDAPAQDDNSRLLQQVDLLTEGKHLFRTGREQVLAALRESPNRPDARLAAADLFGEAAWLHESAGDIPRALELWREARRYAEDPARFPQKGSVLVTTDPPDAVMTLFRVDASDPNAPWAEERVAEAVRSPWTGAGLEPGSYILEIATRSGSNSIRFPFLLPLGEDVELPEIRIPPDEDFEAGWIYIPPGRPLLGGDRLANASRPWSRDSTEAFFMRQTELSWGEYYEFLEYLIRNPDGCQGYECAELKQHRFADGSVNFEYHFPRDSGTAKPRFTKEQLLGENGQRIGGTFLQPDATLILVRVKEAEHYLLWLNARSAESGEEWVYGLPSEPEWVFAARGVDGRHYPWGNASDARLVLFEANPHFDEPLDYSPGRAPADRSVFGVLDMASGAREFTRSMRFGKHVVCGGSQEGESMDQLRLSRRAIQTAEEWNWGCGIRLIRRRRP